MDLARKIVPKDGNVTKKMTLGKYWKVHGFRKARRSCVAPMARVGHVRLLQKCRYGHEAGTSSRDPKTSLLRYLKVRRYLTYLDLRYEPYLLPYLTLHSMPCDKIDWALTSEESSNSLGRLS